MAESSYDFLSSTIVGALTFTTLALYTLYKWLLPKPIPGIAYNPEATKSLFGDAPSMLEEVKVTGEFRVWCANQVKKMNSPICQVFVRPFSKPWVLLADFRESRDILMRRKEFDKAPLITEAMACLGDFHGRFKTGDAFRANRQLVQDLMTSSFLNTFVGPTIHAKGLELLDLFERKMNLAKGRPFSVGTDVEYAALDVMLRFAFGRNWTETTIGPQVDLLKNLDPKELGSSDIDEEVKFPQSPVNDFLWAIYEAPHVVERAVVAWSPRLSLWWWKRQSWYKKVFEQKDRVIRGQVAKGIENYRAGKIESAVEHMLMREAARAEKQGREPDFQTHVLIDEIFGNVIAGHHTTSGAMMWLIKYLTDNPHIQSKLRNILYSSLASAAQEKRFPTFEELRSTRIPYLDAVLEEMLRLNAVTVNREAQCDTEILGHPIPKGTEVFLVSNGPGFLTPPMPIDNEKRTESSRAAKLRDTWDETNLTVFDPERWLVYKEDGDVEFDGAAGPQLVFGLGPRACWGRRLAHMEMRTIIALLVWKFELLETPPALSSYAGYEGIARVPQMCYVRLRKTQ